MRALITVRLKKNVLDPQGSAITNALHALAFDEVVSARQSKLIELDLNVSDTKLAHQRVTQMCEQLIANTVIEDYEFELLS